MAIATVREGERFVMLDYFGRKRDRWQVVHAILMPSGRQRTTVVNVVCPGDALDIYADELLDPKRFVALDASGRASAGSNAQLAA